MDIWGGWERGAPRPGLRIVKAAEVGKPWDVAKQPVRLALHMWLEDCTRVGIISR